MENLKNIEKSYDRLAKDWARAFSGEHDHKPMDQQVLQRFVNEMCGKGSVLDLGCGPGNTSRILKDCGLDICGLDLSENLVSEARLMHPDIRFEKGNMLALPFTDDSVAGIVSFYSIIHFSDEQVITAFREMFRVLSPGGSLLMTYHIGEETLHIDEFLDTSVDLDFRYFSTSFIKSKLVVWIRIYRNTGKRSVSGN